MTSIIEPEPNNSFAAECEICRDLRIKKGIVVSKCPGQSTGHHSLKASGRAVYFLSRYSRPEGGKFLCNCITGSGLDKAGDPICSTNPMDHTKTCRIRREI